MYTPRLKEKYFKEAVPKIMKDMGYENKMAVPKLVKIVVNAGVGKILKDSADDFERIIKDFTNIVGQKPVVTKAKKAISGFKVREGVPLGLMATLRGARMYEFLDRLINVVFPQVRDFRNFSKKSFDGRGQFNLGIREHIVFPEVNKDDIRKIFGIEITIVTNAKNDEEGYKLLKSLGFPITEEDK